MKYSRLKRKKKNTDFKHFTREYTTFELNDEEKESRNNKREESRLL